MFKFDERETLRTAVFVESHPYFFHRAICPEQLFKIFLSGELAKPCDIDFPIIGVTVRTLFLAFRV